MHIVVTFIITVIYRPLWKYTIQEKISSDVVCKTKANFPDSKIHGANMGLTWVLSAPDGPHVSPMNLAIRVGFLMSMTWVRSTRVSEYKTKMMLMAQCKKDVTPLLTHLSYVLLALTHRFSVQGRSAYDMIQYRTPSKLASRTRHTSCNICVRISIFVAFAANNDCFWIPLRSVRPTLGSHWAHFTNMDRL